MKDFNPSLQKNVSTSRGGHGSVRDENLTEPNWTKPNYLHFELNWTDSNQIELFWTEPNCYYWYGREKY